MIHILVIDDDKILNKTMCTYLNDCGFKTKGVFSANEAYDELYGSLYDLIISDIMLPGIDGFELADTIRGSISKSRFCSFQPRMIYPPSKRAFAWG